MCHVRDDELYAIIDEEIRDAGEREFLSVREKFQLRSWEGRFKSNEIYSGT